MKFKKIIKNTIIFAAMMLIIGVYTAPVISKAGNTFGLAFSVDGENQYTDNQAKKNIIICKYDMH